MPEPAQPIFLLACGDRALLREIEPILIGAGRHVSIVLSADASLAAMTAPDPESVALPSLVLLDAGLPGMPLGQLRPTLLWLLFRETDRVQRMGTSLCGILFDIDDSGHWNSAGVTGIGRAAGPGSRPDPAAIAELRSARTPGQRRFSGRASGLQSGQRCSAGERLRDSFGEPFHVADAAVRLSACCAVRASQGRSPVVLWRELEGALAQARETGPETIQTATDCPAAQSPTVAFLSATSEVDLLAW